MCKFIGKSNERILCKLSNSKWNFKVVFNRSCWHGNNENLTFYLSIKMFLSIFFICQASACELLPFSCHDLANDIYSQTAETVFSHLNYVTLVGRDIRRLRSENPSVLKPAEGKWKNYYYHYQISSLLSSSSSSSSSSLLLL